MDLNALRVSVQRNPGLDEERLAAAREREPALLGYPTVQSLITPWIGQARLPDEQYSVVRALLREYQRDAAPWSRVVLVAMLPMIGSLHRRVARTAGTDDNIVTLVVDAFYVECARVNTHARAAIRKLRRATERRTFEAIRCARLETELAVEIVPSITPDMESALDMARESGRHRGRTREYERLKKQRARARVRESLPLAA